MTPPSNPGFRSIFYSTIFLLLCLVSRSATAFNSHKPFDFSSDSLEYDEATQDITAVGNVTVVQGSSTLQADRVLYNKTHKRLHGEGNVILRDKGSFLMGEVLDYDLVLEKAFLEGGKGFGSPWYFQGSAWEKAQDYFRGRDASFTTCMLPDAHYHVRSSRVHLIPDRMFWAWNNVFYVDNAPAFYTPFLYKSFGPKRVVFQVQPGHDTVKGAFAKTVTTIRMVPGIYDKVLLDHYTTSGTGYGNELHYERGDYKGSLFGYFIDPKGSPELVGAPDTAQYNVRFYHWQRVSERLTFQSNINHRKNVSFNNQFFNQDTNQSVTDVNNSAALTYVNHIATQRLVVETLESPDENSDPLFGNTHVQTASLPRYEVTFFQKPIWSPQISTNTLDQVLRPNHLGSLQLSGNGTFENSYSRIDEQTRLKANGSTSLALPININRQWSFTGTVSPSLRWQDEYDPFVNTSTGTTVAIPYGIFRGYQGRMSTSGNLRYRPLSALTLDQTYQTTWRMTPNEFSLDRRLQDGGVETHRLNWLLYWRPSRQLLWRSFSGYDLRRISDEEESAYRQRRVDPWTNELTIYQSKTSAHYFLRHQLAYYPTRTSLWEADARWAFDYDMYLQTGLSYNASQRGVITWNKKAGFYFSPAWRVDAVLNTLIPNDSLSSAKKGSVLQSEFVVTRNMHCWDAKFIYKNQPPFTREYSILVNLRFGPQSAQTIENKDLEAQFYPWRADERYNK
jgi:hypothetical protein